MDTPIIMSEGFKAAILHEIHTITEVICNYDKEENIFEMDDLIRYRRELEELYENWITAE